MGEIDRDRVYLVLKLLMRGDGVTSYEVVVVYARTRESRVGWEVKWAKSFGGDERRREEGATNREL